MSSTGPVMVGVDGSPASLCAVEWAADEADRRGLPLEVVHVDPRATRYASGWPAFTRWDRGASADVARGILAEAARAAADRSPGVEVTCTTVAELPVPGLVGVARRAALLVLGRRRIGVADALLGFTARSVVERVSCPVILVPAAGGASRRETGPGVVVAVDPDENCRAVVDFAFEEASRRQVPLSAVHAWTALSPGPGLQVLADDPDHAGFEQRRLLAEAVAGRQERFPDVAVRHHVVRGPARRVVPEAGDGATLLVVGAGGARVRGRTALGPVSDAAIRRAPCPVAVVHGSDTTRGPRT
ncbi:universal stress protein [Spongisporangium articulatum]|uniref:Universal stress protein n=1 Tax=Spongisporangium articulatum TaxID=3362603 RepID=A0ABW8AM08_9ACTN